MHNHRCVIVCKQWKLVSTVNPHMNYMQRSIPSAPTDPPRNVYLTPFGSIAMTISWYPPLQPNGRIIGSNIYANFSNGTMKIIKLTGGNYRRYLLQNMQPEQEVQIQISSSTNGGEGPRSDIHLGRTGKLYNF